MFVEITTHKKFRQIPLHSNLLVNAVLLFVTMCAIPVLSTPPAGSAWHLNWSDDFDGTTYNTANWGLMYTIAVEQVRASQISVANGICTFTGAKEGSTYISGGLTSTNKHMDTYGYWEIRAKLPQSPGGTWPAIWLPGCNGDWHPEIDIVDGTSSTCYWRAAHWDFGSGDQLNADNICPDGGITLDFHTYGMQWTKDSIMWYYDEMRMKSVATAGMNFPGCPLPLIINLQLGGWGGGTIDDSKLPFYMQIDWVKMWQLNTNTTDPVISLSPASITVATPIGTSPAAKTIAVTNSGAGTLSVVTTSVSYQGQNGWLTAVPSGSGNSQIITNTFASASLATGTYRATVTAKAGTATEVSYGVTLTVTPPPGPYQGVPVSLPGVIEAEQYDEGGEGVAYHDVDPQCQGGGNFRISESVDMEVCSDTNAGFDIGYISDSEWLKYTVSVSQAGSYTIGFRVAAQSQAGVIQLKLDSIDLGAPVTLPITGGWQTWQTVSLNNVLLPAGTHALTVSIVTGGFNFNWLSVTSVGSTVIQPPAKMRNKGHSSGPSSSYDIRGRLVLEPASRMYPGILVLRLSKDARKTASGAVAVSDLF